MKKYYKLIGSGLVAVAAVFLLAGTVGASGAFRSGDSISTGKKETINGTLFIAGNNVNVNGTVNGDVFCAGQNVSVTGTVNGDVICAGQNVRVDGTVTGDVRLAGQTVTLEGTVQRNATVASSAFTSTSESSVGGDMTVFGQNTNLNGTIGRDLVASGETVTLSGRVGRDLNGEIKQLTFTDNAVIKGNVTYASKNEVNAAKGTIVGGSIERTTPTSDKHDTDGWQTLAPLSGGFWFYMLVSMLLVALAVVLIAPRHVHAVSEHVMRRPWRTLLVGFVAAVAVPVLLIVLAITLVGIPLALLVLLIWLLLQSLAGPMIGYVAGRWILRSEKPPVLTMLVGSLVIIVLYFIPIVGFITIIAVMWLGVGALLTQIYTGEQRQPVKRAVKKKA